MEDEENTEIPTPTTEASGCIKPIKTDTIHKICSGQVVLSLAVAVKELVENSIDADATLIEIKLKDQGLESVEVSDNGTGVTEHNLEAMTAKYHTSKIREFIDLQGVETFGFRGEALSSLCALCDVTILTRHSSTDVGIKIDLDHNGKIVKRLPCARSIGTTVTLTNLFATLPVRKRDFTRNIKKEFSKMCQILQAYCLISKNIRIICSNSTQKVGKTIVMQTLGSSDVLTNISAIFGNRQAQNIVPLQPSFTNEQLNEQNLLQDTQNDIGEGISITNDDMELIKMNPFTFEGYVSNCSHGLGRSSKDRQYFYVNSRPCDQKNISKVMNDVYNRYNVNQYPFIFLNIITARCDVDINLQPDKRQLLINNEKILLLLIKKALLNTYGNIPSTYKMQNTTIVSMFKTENTKTDDVEIENETIVSIDDDLNSSKITSTQAFANVLSQWKHTGDTKGKIPTPTPKRKNLDELQAHTFKLRKIHEYLSKDINNKNDKEQFISYKSDESDEEKNVITNDDKDDKNTILFDIHKLQQESAEYDALTHKMDKKKNLLTNKKQNQVSEDDSLTQVEDATNNTIEKNSLNGREQREQQQESKNDESLTELNESLIDNQIICKIKAIDKPKLIFQNYNSNQYDMNDLILTPPSPPPPPPPPSSTMKTITLDLNEKSENNTTSDVENYFTAEIRTSLEEIEKNFNDEEKFIAIDNLNRKKLERLRFKSEINPNQNQNAEAELQKEISKESFSSMNIIGQFNLGFIIVKLNSDLFIVDQHATDEKYNFEMLQRTTVLQNQLLAVPQTLELTAVNEMILLDHLKVFESNGFKFDINKDAPTTKRIRLLAKPFSKNWEFGKEDIDELLFMLQDAPEGTICRPSRIRSMFASRACRKSVMIGKALNKSAMKQLITHMGEIEQPWNCPHGRPTMRHLINTELLED